MKVLFIGGTGLISSACTELACRRGIELYLLNRGKTTQCPIPPQAKVLNANIKNKDEVIKALGDHTFDAVVNWIVFTPDQIEQDIEIFAGRTSQYVFISSASVYQKPVGHYRITESTPLANTYWQYSRNKIACENRLIDAYRDKGFPAVIVRPSLTYGPTLIPLAVNSWNKSYTVIDRMLQGKEVIIPGDGTSLWTCTFNADFAKAFVPLLGHQQTIGEAFHITSDEVLCWNQLYQAAADLLGVELKAVHVPSEVMMRYFDFEEGNLLGDKAWSTVFDNSKVKSRVPDFVATTTWKQGLAQCIEWFQADPSRIEIDDDANETWDRIIADMAKVRP
jgi:nucleoside-diphosphate-sugar epimerase